MNKNNQSILALFAGWYNKESIQKAEDFVLKCHGVLKEQTLLWISFQSNCFADVADTHSDFNDSVIQMKKTLYDEGFHLAALSANMRNSNEIAGIEMDTIGGGYNMQDNIQHLKASTHGTIPMLIPLYKRDKETKFDEVLQHALESNSFKGNLMLIHDDQFESSELKNKLNKLFNDDIGKGD